jgi:hypothetical protein
VAATLAALSALVSLAGCSGKPTYPKEHLAESLQGLLRADGIDASIRVIDHTLGVQFSHAGALEEHDGRIGIGEGFDDAGHAVLTAIHRVLLSSDAPIRFYVMLLSDPGVPGAYLTLVRYMDDVRQAHVNMIDTPEMFARMVLDLNYLGQDRAVTIEQYVPRDIRLEDFLSWQIAKRIQRQLTEELEDAGIAQVGRCGGRFADHEFVFALSVSPVADQPIEDTLMHRIFQTSTSVVARVLSNYRFKSFEAVRFTHPLTDRSLVLPKTSLEIFR